MFLGFRKGDQKDNVVRYIGWSMFFVFVLLVLVWGRAVYTQWLEREKFEKRVKKSKRAWQKVIDARYEKAMNDKMGGRTPKKTLGMYIEAVENKNFKKASRYMVIGKKKKELNELRKVKSNSLEIYLKRIKNASISFGGALKRNSFTVRIPSPVDEAYVFLSFVKYPNGIWKISDI
ncbi:MAG: hypothetical protein ABEI53_00060 [Candidatus Magasanikbacteria bacterium]